eukprot:2005906-Rhodomonas_salina.1
MSTRRGREHNEHYATGLASSLQALPVSRIGRAHYKHCPGSGELTASTAQDQTQARTLHSHIDSTLAMRHPDT